MRPALTSSSRRGFTLIEIIIVMVIIVVLIALILPNLGSVKTKAKRTAAMAQLGNLQNALQAYYSDMKSYPSSSTPAYGGLIDTGRGSAMLAQGLMGYLPFAADGAGPTNGDPALGFRTHQASMGGKIYGPYASDNPKEFVKRSAVSPTPPAVDDQFFIDPWGNEILYFRATGIKPVAGTLIFDFAANNDSIFNRDDCATRFDGTPIGAAGFPQAFFQLFCSNPTNNFNGGTVTGSDSYLLISAGPDGIFFTQDDLVVGKP